MDRSSHGRSHDLPRSFNVPRRRDNPRSAAVSRTVLPARPEERPLAFSPGLYLAHTQPGFESVVWSEVAARCAPPTPGQAPAAGPRSSSGSARAAASARPKGPRELGRRLVPDRAGISIFSAARPDPLALVHSAEDVFALVGYRRIAPGGRTFDLDRLRAVAREAPFVEDALTALVRMLPGRRGGRRLGFRVVARLTGEHEFRRVDLQRAIERGIMERGDHSWRPVDDDAEVEFWATMFQDEILLAIRLSDETTRHRDYKVAHVPGSLRPAVAAALGWLSEPAPDDVVLDPLCGAGTVLIERAHLARYKSLIGGDRDADALAAARANIGPRYKPIEIHPWDALALPIPDGSISKAITNLPWGIKHGTHEQNRRSYPRIVAELKRVVRAGGLIVMLTGERRLMDETLRRCRLHPRKILRVSILGAQAAAYVCPVA